MTARATDQPPLSRRSAAFTLIEVLVVISIIIILLAVSIPTIRALTKGNAEKQAVNLLSSLLANARSTAIATHKFSGIVIYEDPTAKNGSSVQLITQSSINSSGKIRYFIRVPRTGPQRIPSGIKIAALDDNAAVSGLNFKTESLNANQSCRAIIFDAAGQMTLINALALDSSLSTDPAAVAWNLNGTTSATASAGVSKPGFIIYNGEEYNQFLASSPPPTTAQIDGWLRQHADVLIVNAYTGNIIR